MKNILLHGDAAEVLPSIPSESIDLTVTSPPYDDLRMYNGYSFSFEVIARELYRVTKKGGVLVWVVGDATKNGSETGTSFRQALFFKECGFFLHDTMIYASDKPPKTHKRYEQEFEFMFVFSRGKPKTFHPLLVPCTYTGSDKKARTFRHTGKELGMTHHAKPVKEHKIKGNIWRYTTGYNKSTCDTFAFQHPAIFPEELVKDHILSWSNPGDVILDPFVGSGTSGKIAIHYGRSFIGIDISSTYLSLAQQRIGAITIETQKGKEL